MIYIEDIPRMGFDELIESYYKYRGVLDNAHRAGTGTYVDSESRVKLQILLMELEDEIERRKEVQS